MLHSIYNQPDAEAVHAQFDRVVEALTEKLPAVADYLDEAHADILAFTAFPKEIWRQIWSNPLQPPFEGCRPPAQRLVRQTTLHGVPRDALASAAAAAPLIGFDTRHASTA